MKNAFEYEDLGHTGSTAFLTRSEMEELEALAQELEEFEWEDEVNRKSREYIRWIQESLNKILGLRLTTDGVMGAQTRSAIRSFQQRQGLTVDGNVGLKTEAVIKAALAGTPPATGVALPAMPGAKAQPGSAICRDARTSECLDRFEFDRDRLQAFHLPRIEALAQCIVASHSTSRPVRFVHIVGHTDPVGSSDYNFKLARRRAAQVEQRLRQEIESLQAGLIGSARINLDIRSRGECEPVSLLDNVLNRRVDIFIPRMPPRQTSCSPFRARIRIHVKIVHPPSIPIQQMIDNMKQVYSPGGFLVELASTETLKLPADKQALFDVVDVGDCLAPPAPLTPEQRELFSHRNSVRNNEIVAYFVRATTPPLNGCAAHAPGQPSLIVTAVASEWTLAHEAGHVLGLNHVDNPPTTERLLDRLMTGGGTNNLINLPPDLVASEIRTIDASDFRLAC